MNSPEAVHSVADLDLQRYLGLWYEIGRLPLKYEEAGATCVTAHYALSDDGDVAVDNRCFDSKGKPTSVQGRAKPVKGEPGQFHVSFLPELLRWIPFTEGDYWVLKIDPDYRVALVGTPHRDYLWLLSREPQLDEATTAAYLAEGQAQGFDLTNWITVVQDGRRVTDDLLQD